MWAAPSDALQRFQGLFAQVHVVGARVAAQLQQFVLGVDLRHLKNKENIRTPWNTNKPGMDKPGVQMSWKPLETWVLGTKESNKKCWELKS